MFVRNYMASFVMISLVEMKLCVIISFYKYFISMCMNTFLLKDKNYVIFCQQLIWKCREEKLCVRSRQIELKLRWSCWPPQGGSTFFEYILKYVSYVHNFFPAQRITLKTPSSWDWKINFFISPNPVKTPLRWIF